MRSTLLTYLFLISSVSTAQNFELYAKDTSSLCNGSKQNQISFPSVSQGHEADRITFITWNAHKFADLTFFSDLRRITHEADILVLQEAMHSTLWQKDLTTLIDFNFSFHKSFCMPFSDKATGVINASKFPLHNNRSLVSPGVEPGSLTHKVTAYSQIVIKGQVVHILNTHALNFNAGPPFEYQIYKVAKFISKLEGPVIWAGDFNTWNKRRYNYLMKATKALKLKHLKPEKDPRGLKLDHIFVRGFTEVSTEILEEKSSDHFPIKTVLELQ